ncbi:hypothetical protein TPE_2245 [Treponema pedis str. T A4]|uniref:Uncharacterized protein n=1 Tax=Treponema pedis str. T A4 TaxID=1291379 RepID=S6A901_9SPIR|nr:hypothetical protein TPE_2245 [Treponema pedis str. T A4]
MGKLPSRFLKRKTFKIGHKKYGENTFKEVFRRILNNTG